MERVLELKKEKLQSSFQNKAIELFVYGSEVSKNYCIIIHGLYGVYDPSISTSRDNLLIEKIQEEYTTTIIAYNSSRHFAFDESLEFSKRQDAFLGKSFYDEVNDLAKVIDYVLNENPEAIISLIGKSFGGTIMIPVLAQKKYNRNILNAIFTGSGCGTNGSTKPLLSTHPGEKELLQEIEKYRGNLFLLQGELDTVVPLKSGYKIYSEAGSKKKLHKLVKGINHSFSQVFGKKNLDAKKIYVNLIIDFLRDNINPLKS